MGAGARPRDRDQRGGRRGVGGPRTARDEPVVPAQRRQDRAEHRDPVGRAVPVRERPRLVRELVEAGGARGDVRRGRRDRLRAREGVPDVLGRHALRVDVLLRPLRDPRGTGPDHTARATGVRLAGPGRCPGACRVSDLGTATRGRGDDVGIPAALLAAPPRPWWWWLTSDRAARYT